MDMTTCDVADLGIPLRTSKDDISDYALDIFKAEKVIANGRIYSIPPTAVPWQVDDRPATPKETFQIRKAAAGMYGDSIRDYLLDIEKGYRSEAAEKKTEDAHGKSSIVCLVLK